MSVWVDNRGTEIAVGQEVAYNMSGEVCKGRIVKIIPKTKRTGAAWDRERVQIQVELIEGRDGYHGLERKGWVSKVNSPKNLLVLRSNES